MSVGEVIIIGILAGIFTVLLYTQDKLSEAIKNLKDNINAIQTRQLNQNDIRRCVIEAIESNKPKPPTLVLKQEKVDIIYFDVEIPMELADQVTDNDVKDQMLADNLWQLRDYVTIYTDKNILTMKKRYRCYMHIAKPLEDQ